MRKGFVLAALTVAGVIGSVGEASAFFRKKKKRDNAVVAVPAATYSQPACGCDTGIGTNFVTPSHHGGSPGYGMSGSVYSPSLSYPQPGMQGVYYPSGR